uniref:Protein kinase domain-containing protein n=1 Tax=Picocystis salinarum TaxID=88271 RepID=A0A7S3XDK9_9CHLO|mmetsp:Transcript_10473/g.64075  ORF Transcript_10473/g.64075 Transcript_10473/m.64075 type:complete len:810 (-) Transcript_10473:5-2434(-)
MVSGRVRTKAEEEKPEKGGGSLEGQGKDTWDKRLRSRAAAILGRKNRTWKQLRSVQHRGFEIPTCEWKAEQVRKTSERCGLEEPTPALLSSWAWKDRNLSLQLPLSFSVGVNNGNPTMNLSLFKIRIEQHLDTFNRRKTRKQAWRNKRFARVFEQFAALHVAQLLLPQVSNASSTFVAVSWFRAIFSQLLRKQRKDDNLLRTSALCFVGSRSFAKLLLPRIHFQLSALQACILTMAKRRRLQRQCARGSIKDGRDAESAWRNYHRWAAKKLAPFIIDLVDKPPLEGLFALMSTLSIDHSRDGLSMGRPPLFSASIRLGRRASTSSMEMCTAEWTEDVQCEGLKEEDYSVGVRHLSTVAETTEALRILCRALYLAAVFFPFLSCCPSLLVVDQKSWIRTMVWKFLLLGITSSGAALIKWGQWAATREDLFPTDLCRVLSSLHDDAPKHSFRRSRRQIEHEFGCDLFDIFDSFEEEPVASGSIAQVHIAVIRESRICPEIRHHLPSSRKVAVKVRHPNVAEHIRRDFQVVKPLVNFLTNFRAFRWLGLKESVSQFSHVMTAQADLTVEADHLYRCGKNFAHVEMTVIPLPIRDLISPSVLVETFEEGRSVAGYMKAPSAANTQIVNLGIDTYLHMLLKDNFVHTDLHPGNIMVREMPCHSPGGVTGLQLILLDFGLVVELTPEMRHRFISFLFHIASGNSMRASELLLSWAKSQHCTDVKAFRRGMADLWDAHCGVGVRQVDVDRVLKECLRLCRQYEVSVDVEYAELVLGVCIITGFATQLDPEVNLMDAAVPCFFLYNLLGRVSGRVYD